MWEPKPHWTKCPVLYSTACTHRPTQTPALPPSILQVRKNCIRHKRRLTEKVTLLFHIFTSTVTAEFCKHNNMSAACRATLPPSHIPLSPPLKLPYSTHHLWLTEWQHTEPRTGDKSLSGFIKTQPGQTERLIFSCNTRGDTVRKRGGAVLFGMLSSRELLSLLWCH